MNTDDILAELDAQYQELIESVQLEGLSQDENSDRSGLQNVSEIIRKYEQTLQTSREFYENEIKKLEDTKRKTEAKYIESKKKIKHFENRINKRSETHQSQLIKITEQKDREIKTLKDELDKTLQKYTTFSTEHAECSKILRLNQEALERLQQEKYEIKTKYESAKTDVEELQSKYCEQNEMISQKKSDVEKFKLEIIQTRTCFDEQQNEFEDLQQQLKECRDEINFLCTTNEDLYRINEDLSKKLEKYPQANSLLNSMIVENDDSGSIQQIQLIQNVEQEEKKGNDSINGEEISIFDLNDSNNIEIDECPILKTASTMYMMESIEDSKIKQEMQRLSQDANTWNHQYEAVCKEKQQLVQTIKKYDHTIQDLNHQLLIQQSMPNEGQITEIPSQKEMESMINVQNEIKELNEQKLQNDDALKQFMDLNESNQREIGRLNEEIKQFNLKKVHALENNHNNNAEIEEKNEKISQLNTALKILSEEKDKYNQHIIHLESTLNEYQNKAKEFELTVARWSERYENVSKEYTELQSIFHETKLKLHDTLSKEEEYKQQIQRLTLNMKYILKEMEQSKHEQIQLRSNNSRQNEEISQLNHDLKQMFSDLEKTRMQLLQSQQLIGTLEKQCFGQNQQLQQTRQSLQMQMNINMQNLNVMNNLKSTQRTMNHNEFQNHINTMNKIQHLNTVQSTSFKDNKPGIIGFNTTSKPYQHPVTETQTPPISTLISRTKTEPIPDDIMDLARGKPFHSKRHRNINSNYSNNNQELSSLIQQKQKIETELFKLPLKPRSLAQRKRKHSLESTLNNIESKIDSIKKQKYSKQHS